MFGLIIKLKATTFYIVICFVFLVLVMIISLVTYRLVNVDLSDSIYLLLFLLLDKLLLNFISFVVVEFSLCDFDAIDKKFLLAPNR